MKAAAACAALLALCVVAACTPQTLPRNELRSGLPQDAVRAKIEKEPERAVSFALSEQPELQFTVLEYLLAPEENAPEQPYWVLLDDEGLISFGLGGLREANARAYDSYYQWMAVQGGLPRAAAEQMYRAKLLELYGSDINPEVDEFMTYRAEAMHQVDAKQIDEAEARRRIYAKYVELEARNRTAADPLLTPAEADRFAMLAQMGLDRRSARLAQRPRAIDWSLACAGFGSRLGTQRCR
jgi:hypothetical protein